MHISLLFISLFLINGAFIIKKNLTKSQEKQQIG